MPGHFSVGDHPALQAKTLDELKAAAYAVGRAESDKLMQPGLAPAQGLEASDFSNASAKVLARIAKIATPYELEIKDANGQPILLSDLEKGAADKIVALMEKMEPGRRHQVLKMLRRDMAAEKRQKNAEVAATRSELGSTEQRIEHLRRGEMILQDLSAWMSGPGRLQRPHGSCLHQLHDAVTKGDIWGSDEDCVLHPQVRAHIADSITKAESFLIEHNWASAFANAGDFDAGEVRLPHEICAFEMRISDRRVIAMVRGDVLELTAAGADGLDPKRDNVALLILVESKHGWWCFNQKDVGDLKAFARQIYDQIRAALIALDAEVAETEVVRAPHKLNRARERAGRMPLVSFHVINLARRQRAPRLERDPDAPPGTRRRLHFRRGHWRHFVDHKTWIKWMLVGDPDLGFVDKEYRL